MLNAETFTRKNIQNVICDGRDLSSFPSQTNPYFIIKVGPPGVGKSSSNNHIIAMGVDPLSAIYVDIDKINASFKLFRNKTRNLQSRYDTTQLNNVFFNELSKIHNEFKYLKCKNNGRNIRHDITYVVTEAIKQHNHIIMETVRPINHIITLYGKKLQNNNYKIAVIYYKPPPVTILQSRILKRGEDLYATQQYYRAFQLNTLNNVISKLEENLREYIVPLVIANKINTLIINE
jgi:hypothetical protein